jgi:hypothetical protein
MLETTQQTHQNKNLLPTTAFRLYHIKLKVTTYQLICICMILKKLSASISSCKLISETGRVRTNHLFEEIIKEMLEKERKEKQKVTLLCLFQRQAL